MRSQGSGAVLRNAAFLRAMGDEAREVETNVLMGTTDAAYTLWENGRNRYAVTLGRNAVPIVGIVRQTADDFWIIQRAGKILPALHRTADDAAKALVELVNAEGII